MHAVTLRAVQQGDVTLRGFFIQGRTVFQNTVVGSFADPAVNDPTTHLSSCTPPSVSVTHNNGARIDLSGPFTFLWTAPGEGTGPVWLCYTIVETILVWWANDTTAAIQEGKPKCEYNLVAITVVTAISTPPILRELESLA